MKNYWKNKKVLVTGGAGFIGSNMAKELVMRKSIVTITVSKSSSRKELNKIFGSLIKKIKIKKVNLLLLEDCLKVTKNIDIVLNFAALDGGARFKKEHAEEIYKSNIKIVENMLDASRINNIDRILILSSIDVYSKKIKSSLINEESKLSTDTNGYVGAKIFSEQVAKKFHDKYGLKIAIARLGNVYGPGDKVGFKKVRVIPMFIKKAINNENIEILSSSKFSFLHISDLVPALLNLTERYAICDPVNIASSKYVTLKSIADLIIKLSKSKSKTSNIKLKYAFNNKKISINKAKKIIHFREKNNIKHALKELIEFPNQFYL